MTSPPSPRLADLILATLLLVGMPAFALWRSVRFPAGAMPRLARYRHMLLIIATLMVALALDWLAAGRSASALGVGVPTTVTARIGLLAAVILLAVAAIVLRRPDAQRGDVDLLPASPTELRWFLAFSLAAGLGWELLYRGYLMWLLTPSLGIPAAVLATSMAYGLAHGYRSAKQCAGSLLSACAFTVAYVATHSLWWLMLIHTGLPVLGGLARRKAWAASTA